MTYTLLAEAGYTRLSWGPGSSQVGPQDEPSAPPMLPTAPQAFCLADNFAKVTEKQEHGK